MFKRQTRAWSAILVVCMLLSLLASFALPVSAEAAFVSDEVVAEKGLVDATGFADITEYTASVKKYKVSDRAGMDKLADLVADGNTMAGVSIYQTADIDMGWVPFFGIGLAGSNADKSKPFSGTYYGNGFTIDNLYITNSNAYGSGLFNTAKDAAFHDIFIASGLIIGNFRAASIVGGHIADANLKLYNCFSAATVITGGNNGSAGLVSNAVGVSALYNCAFLGMLYTRHPYAAGITAGTDKNEFRIENCYVYGNILSGVNTVAGAGFTLGIHSAFIRPGSETMGKVGNNNYYVNDGRMKSTSSLVGGSYTTDDDGTALNKADFATQDTADRLNGGAGNIPAEGQKEGYEMKFTPSTAGYPVITYYKDGEIYSKRHAHTTTNVGENTIAEKSSLFKKVSDNLGAVKTKAPMGDLKIDNANDLFALSLLIAFRGTSNASEYSKDFGLTSISIEADIDMKDMDIFPIEYYLPLAAQNPMDVPIEGNYHVIKNYKTYAYAVPENFQTEMQVGFIGYAASEVNHLGLVDADVTTHAWVSSTARKGIGLMAGYASGATFNGCFATGTVYATNGACWRGTDIGGLVGTEKGGSTVFNGCWSDAKVEALYNASASSAIPAIGYSDINPYTAGGINGVYYFAENEPTYGMAHMRAEQGMITSETDLIDVALDMNQANDVAVWGMNEDNTLAFADGENTVVGVFIQRVSEGGLKAGEPTFYKATKPGEILVLPTIEGYEVNASTLPDGVVDGKLKMPNTNITLEYTAKCFDMDVIKAINDIYGNLGENLFTPASISNLKYIKGYCKTLAQAAETDEYTDAEKYQLQLELENLVATTKLELVGKYPNIPGYSLYNVLKDYNTSGVWGISTKEDWLAVTSVPTAQFNPKLELHLTNDIDMENELSMPLYYGGTYSGVIDGHGYAFKNLNVTMNGTNPDLPIGGIVSHMSGGKIMNLGIESGIVDITNHQASNDNYGIGLFCGWAVNATFTKCWAGSGATLKLTNCKNDSSYGIIVGRGANTFDSCYNYAKIESNGTPNHVSHLGDWNTNASRLNNSFGVTNASNASIYMYRANGTGNNVNLGNNLWIVGGTNICHSSAINTNSGKLSTSAVSNGELAYKLWANYVEGRGTQNYYTVEGGKTVFGTADTQYYAVRVVNGDNVKEWYGKPGTKVNISSCGVALDKLELQEGSAGTVDGYNVTMGKGNTEFVVKTETTPDPDEPGTDPDPEQPVVLDFGALKALLKKIGSVDFGYFVDAEGMKAKYEKVNAEYVSYTTQAQINASVAALNDLYTLDGSKIVPASLSSQYCKIEGNAEYPMIGIYTVADLEYAASVSATYTTAQKLYLCADLDLGNSGFAGFAGLKAAFDGQDHVIRNWAVATRGFFNEFTGGVIENIVFDDCHTSTTERASALVIGQTATAATTVRNITVTNCSVSNNTEKDAYNVGIICGGTAGNDTFENIVVRDSEVKGKSAEQTAILIGAYNKYSAGSTVTVKNVLIDGCANNAAHHNDGSYSGYESGLLVGKWNGNMTLDVTNLILSNCSVGHYVGANVVPGKVFGSLIGTMSGASTKAYFRNVIAYNNSTGYSSLVGVDTVANSATNPVVVCENVYTDAKNAYCLGGYTGRIDLKEVADFEGVNKATAEQFKNGAAAYEANKAIGEKLFAVVDSDVVYATEEILAPTKQVIQLNGVIRGSIFTDSKGKLDAAAWSDVLDMVSKMQTEIPVEWMCEGGDPAALTYTEDGAIMGVCCYHEWKYATGEDGKHVKSCDLCGGVVPEACEVDWVHKDGTHSGVCELCDKDYSGIPCDWVSVGKIEQDCENAAAEEFQCSVCEEYKVVVEEGSEPLGHLTKYVYNEASSASHFVECERDGCGYSRLENCTEAPNPTVVKPSYESDGYTEWTCIHCEGKWKTGVTNAIAVVDADSVALVNGATSGKLAITVSQNRNITEMKFKMTYNPAELTYKGMVLTEAAAAVADLSVTEAVKGTLEVTITAKEGQHTNVEGALVEAEFAPADAVTLGKKYGVAFEAVSANVGGKATLFEGAKEPAYVKVVEADDINTDGVVNTVDLTDMLKHLVGKDIERDFNTILADLNGDGIVDLVDAVELARKLA